MTSIEHLRFFDESIRFGNESQLHSDVGLAAERAANVLRQCGREPDAIKYVKVALQAYSDRGAYAKVDQIRDQWKLVGDTS